MAKAATYSEGTITPATRLLGVTQADPTGVDGEVELYAVPSAILSLFLDTGVDNGEVAWAYVTPEPFSLPAGLAGSAGTIAASPAASFVLNVQKNGSNVGTVTVTDNAVAFAMASATSFDAGDVLTMVATANAAFTYMAISLAQG